MTSLMLILAVALWGLSFVATKYCLDYLTPAEIIAARFSFAVPVLLAISIGKRLNLKTVWRQPGILIGCSLVLVFHLTIQVIGMQDTTATNTAWLITTIPVFIVILSFFFLGERIVFRQGIGMAVAAAGVIVLVSRGNPTSLDFAKSWGDWLVLGSCLTWAVYTILTKKLSGSHSLAVTANILTLSATIAVPYVLIDSGFSPYLKLPWPAVLALIFLGVFCLGIAYWLWSEGLARKTAGRVGGYLYLEPLSTMMAAPFILGEELTLWLILGGIMVVSGVWQVEKLARRSRFRKKALKFRSR